MASSRTSKTAAKKAAAPAPAKDETPAVETPTPEAPEQDEQTEQDETPAPDAPADDAPADDDEAEDEGEDEGEQPAPSNAPRQEPASAALEAPSQRIPPGDGVKPTAVITDNSGQLSVDMLTQGPSEVRSELYDAATKKAPSPDEVFDLEFPNGQAVICQIRLCENLWVTGQSEPMSRLVMARGQRTDRAYAEQIIAILKQQLGGTESPAQPLEV